MKINHLAFLLLSGILLTGCIGEIKLDIGDVQQRLIVDGLIADSLQEYTIKVNYSAVIGDVSTDNILPPVSGASVRVLDDAGGSFDFTETEPGVYTNFMQGEVGKSYHVEVKTPDGKTLLSKPALLSKAPPLLPPTAGVIEELVITPTGRNTYKKMLSLEMNADVSDLAERPRLRWRAIGEYEFGEDYPGIINRKICYVKNNIDFNNIKIFDSGDLAGGLLENEPFLNMKYDDRFYFMYCFHLFQYAISQEEYNYWENVRDIVNIDGSLFDPPPGTVKGNIYNAADPEEQILGYFSVAGVSYRRHFTNSATLGVSVTLRCGGYPPKYPNECLNCLSLSKSATTTRPAYWEP